MRRGDTAIASIAAWIALSALACATIGAGPEVTGSLEVQVVVEGRDDASGVRVTAGGQSAVTGAEGFVRFDELPAGENISVRATLEEGEGAAQENVTLEPEQLVSITMTIAPANASLDITTMEIDPAGEVPACTRASASVQAEDPADGSLSYAWDAPEGWSIESSGDTAELVAPERVGAEGTLSVTVSNAAGQSDTESLDVVSTASVACELGDWSVRQPISIDTSQVQDPLADVPVLLVLDSERIEYESAEEDGADLRIADASLTSFLDHEIDTWEHAGTSYVWVRIPELSPDEEKVELWMYYGNPDAEDGQNPAGVWQNDYRAVWHGNVAGDGPDVMPDSTANANDADSPFADWTQRIVSGLVGLGAEMEGRDGTEPDTTETYFQQAPVSESLDLSESFTLEAVVEIDEAWPDLADGDSVDWSVVLKGPSGGEERYLLGIARRGGIINCRVFPEAAQEQIRNDQPEGRAEGAEVPVGVPTYLACTYDGDTLASFIDGARVDTLDVEPDGPLLRDEGSDVVYLGRRFGDRRFGGVVDEVRVSSVARSDAWLGVQELAIADELVTIGAPE